MAKKTFKGRGQNHLQNHVEKELGMRLNTRPINYEPYSPNKDNYRMIWNHVSLVQSCMSFEWENLPNGLTSWNLERMLYYRAPLLGFGFGGKQYVLPFAVSGGLNLYGMPTKGKPIPFNGGAPSGNQSFWGSEFELDIDTGGDENPNANAFILYDNIPFSQNGTAVSAYALDKVLIDDICDVMMRLNIEIVATGKKICLQVQDSNQSNIVKAELEEAYGTSSPFVVVSSPFETTELNEKANPLSMEYFSIMKSYEALKHIVKGIQGKSYEGQKAERMISGELSGNDEQAQMIMLGRLMMRTLWAEKMNRAFGSNIRVKKTILIESKDVTDSIEKGVDSNE